MFHFYTHIYRVCKIRIGSIKPSDYFVDNNNTTINAYKSQIKQLKELMEMDPDERIDLRINKYRKMGHFDEVKPDAE